MNPTDFSEPLPLSLSTPVGGLVPSVLFLLLLNSTHDSTPYMPDYLQRTHVAGAMLGIRTRHSYRYVSPVLSNCF